MAGMKGLVDTSASCGDVNPLMKLTTHFSKDRAKTDAGFAKHHSKFWNKKIILHKLKTLCLKDFCPIENYSIGIYPIEIYQIAFPKFS